MKKKYISIIVPVFNGERYIRDTLLSILDQTYLYIECIIVNDGSTDRTLDICREFSDRVVILNKPNSGQSDALNYGWQRARGDYLAYLSADDILKKNAIETLLLEAQKVDDEVVIYPCYELIDERGRKIKDHRILFDDPKSMFEKFYCPIGPGAIFSRSLFKGLGGWRNDLRQIPDFEYWLRLAGQAKFLCCRDILASFRVHDDSQTHAVSDFKKSEESIVVAKNLLGKSINAEANPKKFLASAYIFSACLHIRSGRPFVGIKRLLTAARYSPLTFFSMYSGRRIAASCTSIFRYTNRG